MRAGCRSTSIGASVACQNGLSRFGDSIQLTSLVSTVVDPDTQAKIAVIRERLMRRFGYDELSADDVLQHVAGLFARGAAAAPEGLEAA